MKYAMYKRSEERQRMSCHSLGMAWCGVIDEEMEVREDDCLTYAHATTSGPAGKRGRGEGWENTRYPASSPKLAKDTPAQLHWTRHHGTNVRATCCLEEHQFAACNPSRPHGISSLCFEFPSTILHLILNVVARRPHVFITSRTPF